MKSVEIGIEYFSWIHFNQSKPALISNATSQNPKGEHVGALGAQSCKFILIPNTLGVVTSKFVNIYVIFFINFIWKHSKCIYFIKHQHLHAMIACNLSFALMMMMPSCQRFFHFAIWPDLLNIVQKSTKNKDSAFLVFFFCQTYLKYFGI